MVHTLPDYSSKWKNDTVFATPDMAELAARLKSIDTFDRRGNVVWMDDFEGATLLWTPNGGAGYNVALNATAPYTGSQSCRLTTGGVALQNWAQISKYLSYPVVSNIGFEISSTWDDDNVYFYWQMYLYDGTTQYIASVRYDNAANELLYLDAAAVYQTFATNIDLSLPALSFNTCKLVTDFANGNYSRFICNEVTYDLSAYPIRTNASVTSSRLHLIFYQSGTGVTTPDIYVDHGIATQNEEAQ